MASPKAMRSALHSQLPVDGAGYSYAGITLGDHRPYSACGDAHELLGRTFHGSVTENPHRRRSRGCLLAREPAVFR